MFEYFFLNLKSANLTTTTDSKYAATPLITEGSLRRKNF